MEIPAIINDSRTRRSAVLSQSNSMTNNSLLYQRSMSQLRVANERNPESFMNHDEMYQFEKRNVNNHRSISLLIESWRSTTFVFIQTQQIPNNRRSYHSTTNEPPVYRAESLSNAERDDIYRIQHLYQFEDQEKYQNRSENENSSNAQNTAMRNTAPLMKTSMHDLK